MIAGAIAGVARLVSGARALWVEPPVTRQRVYFANHTSHLDFAVIWSSLPGDLRKRTRPVAGADYWNRGAIRRYLASRVFNAILVERSGGTSSPDRANLAIEAIAAGMGHDCSIIVFPEGTRSLDGKLLPFKSGLYHLCRLKPGLELVPVYLANMNRILPKGEALPVPLMGRVVFGTPIRMQPGEEKGAFLTRARDALLALSER
ncbi:MAG: lysophospholipid acyltransferase family protein [Gemmatimonadaceae bacterium]